MSSHRRALGTIALALTIVAALAATTPAAHAATPPRVLRTTLYFTSARTVTFTPASRTAVLRLAAAVPRNRAGVTVAVTGYTLAPRNTATVVRQSLAYANTVVAVLRARGVRGRFSTRGAGRLPAGGPTARRAVVVITIPAAPTTTTARPAVTSTTMPAAPTSSTSSSTTTTPGGSSTSTSSTTTLPPGTSTSTSTTTTTTTTTTTAPPASVALSNVVALGTGSAHSCVVLTDTSVRCWGANTSGQLGAGTLTDSPLAVAVQDSATGTALTTALSVAAGGGHSCAVLADTTARCWGANGSGQLGDGTTTARTRAVAVVDPADTTVPLTGIASVATGAAHTCAAMTDGTARCWGANPSGQLGDGSAALSSTVPTAVAGPTDPATPLGGISAVTAGSNHTCALMADSTARCWGDGALGQLGGGSTGSSNVPVTVADPADPTQAMTGATALDAGTDHTCATMTDSTGRCWGANDGTQLGDGTSAAAPVPVTVLDPTDVDVTQPLGAVSAIAGGTSHTCAALTDGTARCWGTGADGQLGGGPVTSSAVPAPVLDPANTNQALGGLIAVDSGPSHTCALLGDGTVRCWGLGTSGRLGNGATTSSSLPVAVRSAA